MKTFVFTQKHNYGGVVYGADEKVEVPDDRAAALEAAKVGHVESVEKKAKKSAGRKS